jgi:hypothetical protein
MTAKRGDVAAGFKLPHVERTPVATEAADRFVGETPRGSRRKRAERGERLTVYIPPEVAEALRVRCARERRSLSEAATEALSKWIGSQADK